MLSIARDISDRKWAEKYIKLFNEAKEYDKIEQEVEAEQERAAEWERKQQEDGHRGIHFCAFRSKTGLYV